MTLNIMTFEQFLASAIIGYVVVVLVTTYTSFYISDIYGIVLSLIFVLVIFILIFISGIYIGYLNAKCVDNN